MVREVFMPVIADAVANGAFSTGFCREDVIDAWVYGEGNRPDAESLRLPVIVRAVEELGYKVVVDETIEAHRDIDYFVVSWGDDGDSDAGD